MNNEEFRASSSGKLVSTINGQWAFVPNPLPPAIDYGGLAIPLADAMRALGELNAAGNHLPNPSLVIRPLQRKEALSSSAMEGTHTTANALALAEDENAGISDPQTVEVRNYIRAIEHAEKLLREIPLSNRLIREIHRTLLSGVATERGSSKQPGEFSTAQNFIGGRNRQIEFARFVPPPPAEVQDAMTQLERFIHREDRAGIPAIIDAALIHYQFETIHPFADGNGRVGRILVPIFLMSAGLIDRPLLYVSPAAAGRKDDYADLMLEVSRSGAWTQWIRFFLELVTASCESARDTIAKLERLRDGYRRRIGARRASARLVTLADSLFEVPVMTIPRAATLLSVTYPAAKNAVERLVELRIVDELHRLSMKFDNQQLNLPHHPKRFICREVLALSEDS